MPTLRQRQRTGPPGQPQPAYSPTQTAPTPNGAQNQFQPQQNFQPRQGGPRAGGGIGGMPGMQQLANQFPMPQFGMPQQGMLPPNQRGGTPRNQAAGPQTGAGSPAYPQMQQQMQYGPPPQSWFFPQMNQTPGYDVDAAMQQALASGQGEGPSIADLIAMQQVRMPSQGEVGAGGPALDTNYLSPMGPMEQGFNNMLMSGPQNFGAQGVPGYEFQSAISQGQIPAAQMLQFQQQMQRANEMTANRMQGARFGSDATRIMADEQSRGLNNFLADTQRRAGDSYAQLSGDANHAMDNYLNSLGRSMGMEGARLGGGFNLYNQDLQRQMQDPSSIQGLLGLLGQGIQPSVLDPGNAWMGQLAAGAGNIAAAYGSQQNNRNGTYQQAPDPSGRYLY